MSPIGARKSIEKLLPRNGEGRPSALACVDGACRTLPCPSGCMQGAVCCGGPFCAGDCMGTPCC